MREKPKTWACGITTVPIRYNTTFPLTVASLTDAGFDKPRLFVDGEILVSPFLPLESTKHTPQIGLGGNWILALWELYARNPLADFFAIFQDDIVVCQNLRKYIERCPYPRRGYLNLITYPTVAEVIPETQGWHQSNQRGRGAQALVFDGDAVRTLLSSKYLVNRPMGKYHGKKNIDGTILESMKEANFQEYVHRPSLVDHQEGPSVIGQHQQPKITAYEPEFNPLSLLH